jgi:hypothetical protein
MQVLFSTPLSLAVAMFSAVTGIMIASTSPLSQAEAFFSSTLTTKSLPKTITTALFVSQSSNDKKITQEGGPESEEDFQRRMAVVRSLQMSFYGKEASKKETLAESTNIGNENDDLFSTEGPPELDSSTGIISTLPLFRAAWYELPGRSNVLILRDPIYTNMFERMFYTRNKVDAESNSNSISPWVFGHLYTPRETETDKKKTKQSLKKENGKEEQEQKQQPHETLASWNETNNDDIGTTESALSSPSVMGTLMYVRDYRRLKDGRILALVQAAEKFVVEGVQQSLPYSIADVQVLPDVEELRLEESTGKDSEQVSALPSSVYSCDENDVDERFLVNCLRADEGASAGPARARAIFESIHSYHYYECDPNQRLDGIPHKSNLGIIDITHDAISKALPYCRFSNETKTLANTKEVLTKEERLPSPSLSRSTKSPPSPSLEFQLLQRGITKIPPSDRRFSYNTEPTYSSASSNEEGNQKEVESSRPWTTDELEYELWLVLDYFSATTNRPISPVLLALLPDEDQMPKAWPSSFRLKDILKEQQHHGDNAPSVARKNSSSNSSVYPNHKRQRRFSYSAAYLLEGILPISEGTSSSNHNEGVYSDNFRNGGRRCAPSSSSDKTGTFEVDEIQEFRALLMSIPSTRQRMRVVLETFHRWRLYQECDEFA